MKLYMCSILTLLVCKPNKYHWCYFHSKYVRFHAEVCLAHLRLPTSNLFFMYYIKNYSDVTSVVIIKRICKLKQ